MKECYFYLDATPTSSYLKALYKYPQAEFPYARLLEENHRRTRNDPEFELLDTGIFAGDGYFDVFVEYAKASPNDILIRISAANRGPETATLHLLPTLWFRNTWVVDVPSRRLLATTLVAAGSAGTVGCEHGPWADFVFSPRRLPQAGKGTVPFSPTNADHLPMVSGRCPRKLGKSPRPCCFSLKTRQTMSDCFMSPIRVGT